MSDWVPHCDTAMTAAKVTGLLALTTFAAASYIGNVMSGFGRFMDVRSEMSNWLSGRESQVGDAVRGRNRFSEKCPCHSGCCGSEASTKVSSRVEVVGKVGAALDSEIGKAV